MVKALHGAGIEVILDVVYNHTAEGNHLGPMLSFSGVDNAALLPADAGCAALLPGLHRHGQLAQPGASVGAAADHGLAALLRASSATSTASASTSRPRSRASSTRSTACRRSSTRSTRIPILSQVKLIAEPWDVGPGGYQVGNFPVLWAEWNGMYRDTMRDFWRARASVADFARRFTGSSDLYESRRARPVRVDQLRHRARRLHAARSRLVQREAQRGERRGEQGRHRRQPLVEPRRRGRRRATRRSTRCARASSATSSRRCCSRRACRCCSAATSSDARSAATTTRGARTTSSRGSTGSTRDRELTRVRAAADPAARVASGVPALVVPRPAARRAGRGCRTCGGSGRTGAG